MKLQVILCYFFCVYTTILTAQNVGIGTANPAAPLHVFNDNVLIGSQFVVTAASGETPALAEGQLVLGGAHNQGNNVSGRYKLIISGYDNDNTTGGNFPLFLEDENGFDDFWVRSRRGDANLPTMFFAGNMGIATTAPDGRLHIIGEQQGNSQLGGLDLDTEMPGLIIEQQHSVNNTLEGVANAGFIGPMLDFRSSNATNRWSVGQIIGLIDAGGTNHAGGLAFTTSPGGSINPADSRTQGNRAPIRMLIQADGDVGIGTVTPERQLDVNGYIKGGMLTMGMDCSYEGSKNGNEHNDYGCFMCAVNPNDNNLYCRSTRNDQEEVGDINGNAAGVWTGWTNFGKPGPANALIQSIQVHLESTNQDDDGAFNCNDENDWAAAISIRLTDGNVYFRMTNNVDICVESIGGNPGGSWFGWTNMGQP